MRRPQQKYTVGIAQDAQRPRKMIEKPPGIRDAPTGTRESKESEVQQLETF